MPTILEHRRLRPKDYKCKVNWNHLFRYYLKTSKSNRLAQDIIVQRLTNFVLITHFLKFIFCHSSVPQTPKGKYVHLNFAYSIVDQHTFLKPFSE